MGCRTVKRRRRHDVALQHAPRRRAQHRPLVPRAGLRRGAGHALQSQVPGLPRARTRTRGAAGRRSPALLPAGGWGLRLRELRHAVKRTQLWVKPNAQLSAGPEQCHPTCSSPPRSAPSFTPCACLTVTATPVPPASSDTSAAACSASEPAGACRALRARACTASLPHLERSGLEQAVSAPTYVVQGPPQCGAAGARSAPPEEAAAAWPPDGRRLHGPGRPRGGLCERGARPPPGISPRPGHGAALPAPALCGPAGTGAAAAAACPGLGVVLASTSFRPHRAVAHVQPRPARAAYAVCVELRPFRLSFDAGSHAGDTDLVGADARPLADPLQLDRLPFDPAPAAMMPGVSLRLTTRIARHLPGCLHKHLSPAWPAAANLSPVPACPCPHDAQLGVGDTAAAAACAPFQW